MTRTALMPCAVLLDARQEVTLDARQEVTLDARQEVTLDARQEVHRHMADLIAEEAGLLHTLEPGSLRQVSRARLPSSTPQAGRPAPGAAADPAGGAGAGLSQPPPRHASPRHGWIRSSTAGGHGRGRMGFDMINCKNGERQSVALGGAECHGRGLAGAAWWPNAKWPRPPRGPGHQEAPASLEARRPGSIGGRPSAFLGPTQAQGPRSCRSRCGT
jgi:hypothetical protein